VPECVLLSPEEITAIFTRFRKAEPAPASELQAPNPFTFLVSVVLSAQATDASVNRAALPLYQAADTPQKMLALGEENLRGYIKSIGLYRAKAKHIIALSAKLLADFGGEVPRTREELMTLPGVGRKTANVALNVLWGEAAMPVDTHLLRISPRMGLCAAGTPEAVERALLARIPARFLRHAHHWLILHGRYVCTARKPRCAECRISDICKKNGIMGVTNECTA